MRTRIKRFALAALLLAAVFAANRNVYAQNMTPTDKARESIVYIWFSVTNPTTGGTTDVHGTGFIVSESGYVLTASHLFRDWGKQIDVHKEENRIMGSLRDKPGVVRENPLILQIVNPGNAENEDVALLKVPDVVESFNAASVCLREASTTKVGDIFDAYGFPHHEGFIGVEGKLGTANAAAGRWAAAAPFTRGMSGGPVYNKRGFVVGLIKGGLPGTPAVNWITPIQHAADLLQKAVYVEDCPPGRAKPGTPLNCPGKGEVCTNRFGMEFQLIKPGPLKREGQGDRIVQSFYLQRTEVTQEQYLSVMETAPNPSHFKKCRDCPVEMVSRNKAQEFISRLNDLEKTNRYRLPTESEWEYACKAGSKVDPPFIGKLTDYAWYKSEETGNRTQSVAHKLHNAWFLYDMLGNVWEWVEDDWHDDLKGAPNSGAAWIDKNRNEYGVLRGGSWWDHRAQISCTTRERTKSFEALNNAGFRCVLTKE